MGVLSETWVGTVLSSLFCAFLARYPVSFFPFSSVPLFFFVLGFACMGLLYS